MDIASLLSSDDASQQKPSANSSAASGPKKRPRPMVGNRTPSLLSQEILISPSPEPPRSHGVESLEAQVSQSGFPLATPSEHRLTSTTAVLTTAERPDLNATRSPSTYGKHHPAQLTRTHSAADLVMAEVLADAPAQTPPPRNFTASSISDADLQTINELTSHLAENSYDYNSHVQLINILHRGFVAHIDTPLSRDHKPTQPNDFPLLKELRMARAAADSRWAVGEDIWRDWINDESVLAQSSEDRTAVMELCMKAVQEEPSSVVLWSLYGEWVWSTYAVANGFSAGDEDTWSEEDKLICREVFSREMVLSVWNQAVEATKWRIDESHVVWDRYLELIMQDFPEIPSANTIDELQTVYMSRLEVPHMTHESTSQAFWPFISKHKSDGWEEIMAAANELAEPAKKQIQARLPFEEALSQALRADDKTELYNALQRYIDWQAKPARKGLYNVELRCALYERALLRFPTTVEWWLDYADYLTSLDPSSKAILPLLEKATRHCCWSGELWSRRLLRVEVETQSYEEVEGVKHKATNSGLLPVGGMEEVLLVYSAWCNFLRRRAFATAATDDDIDMAEMAISSTLSDVQFDGKKIYGEGFQGDPLWRIEKIFIKFLSQARRINEAREFWQSLVPKLANSYDFWGHWYDWEILIWGWSGSAFKKGEDPSDQPPHRASEVLKKAMAQRNLDWPEKILELYSSHFNTHETVDEIQKAQIDLRRAQRFLKIRREREAAEAEATAQAYGTTAEYADATVSVEDSTGKRKREEGTEGEDESAAKRTKAGSTAPPESAPASEDTAAQQLKRDREHTTISVTGLPIAITEKDLRQFFKDCGKILSLNIVAKADKDSATATIEFETADDVQTAKTRDTKQIDGHEIRIQQGTLSTLYVTNYPPDYAEAEIRNLFKDYGTITSIRLPSLKFNQRRRFCYVQYLTAEEARAATVLHDKVIDGQHRLVVLISDPNAKKNRAGATAEGREIHIGNIEHTATEQEIRDHFAQVGKVESVRMIKAANGRFTGSAFVIYSTADEAKSALSLDQKPLQTRLLRVSLATDKSSRDASNAKHGTTKVYDPATPTNGTSPAADTSGEDTSRTKRERTICILGLPQTVNDVRVHTLFSPFGAIRQLKIRRDKSAALIEFVNLDDAGRAALQADPSTLGEGCRIGDAAEVFGSVAKTKAPAGGLKPARPVQRPTGRKPLLGRPARVAPAAPTAGEGKKSNDDFRALFLAGKTQEEEE